MSTPQTIGELFATSAVRHAHREAMVYRETRWTYGDLADRVIRGQKVLKALAGGVPKRIAVIGANHPAYVVGYFAAQTLGASTVEIGRDESIGAILQAVAATDAEIILTDREDLLSAARVIPAVSFDDFLSACDAVAPPATSLNAVGEAEDIASIVYTSGTTGSPKGVMLSHRNILFVVLAVCDYLELTAADRYALVLPIAHTYGKSNLLSVIGAGATVVFVQDPHNPEEFYGRIAREECTVLSVVPFHLNILARRGLPPGVDLSALRAVTSSGGPLPDTAVRGVKTLLPHAKLFAMYGLTESSTRATYLPPEWLTAKRGSVGRPLPGMRIEIRQDDGAVMRAGDVGHVFVNGPNVMHGYFGDAELTANTLVNGWLRTGDVGYLDADNCLYLTGREKEIIKVAGERISPVEIEEVLALHPAVAEAAVVGVPDPLLGETVCAYVILNPGVHDIADIAAFCAARLSSHKVPRRFVEVERIPRTPTGKIRRHLLVSV